MLSSFFLSFALLASCATGVIIEDLGFISPTTYVTGGQLEISVGPVVFVSPIPNLHVTAFASMQSAAQVASSAAFRTLVGATVNTVDLGDMAHVVEQTSAYVQIINPNTGAELTITNFDFQTLTVAETQGEYELFGLPDALAKHGYNFVIHPMSLKPKVRFPNQVVTLLRFPEMRIVLDVLTQAGCRTCGVKKLTVQMGHLFAQLFVRRLQDQLAQQVAVYQLQTRPETEVVVTPHADGSGFSWTTRTYEKVVGATVTPGLKPVRVSPGFVISDVDAYFRKNRLHAVAPITDLPTADEGSEAWIEQAIRNVEKDDTLNNTEKLLLINQYWNMPNVGLKRRQEEAARRLAESLAWGHMFGIDVHSAVLQGIQQAVNPAPPVMPMRDAFPSDLSYDLYAQVRRGGAQRAAALANLAGKVKRGELRMQQIPKDIRKALNL